MGFLIPFLFLFIVLGAMKAGKYLPRRVQIGIIAALSLVLALLHWEVAKMQLSTIGFMGANRIPNYPAEVIGYLLAVVGVINILLVFKRVRYAAMLLGLLIVIFPIMYFISSISM